MRLEDLVAALEPFANAADAFKHNMAGVPKPGEHVFKHHYTVQGVEKLATFGVNDIFKLEEAYNFAKGLMEGKPQTETSGDTAGLTDQVDGEIKKNPAPEEVAGAKKLPPDETEGA